MNSKTCSKEISSLRESFPPEFSWLSRKFSDGLKVLGSLISSTSKAGVRTPLLRESRPTSRAQHFTFEAIFGENHFRSKASVNSKSFSERKIALFFFKRN